VAVVVLFVGLVPGTASPAAAGRAWARTDLGAVTQPAPVANRFVVYAHRTGSLEVVALNARDGSTAWAAIASPSYVTAGQPVMLAVRGLAVFYLGRAAGFVGAAQLVARDVASGSVIWRTPAGSFGSWPEICPDQSTAVCVTGSVPGVGSGELRFDAATGRPFSPVKIGASGFSGRELGPDLFDPGSRKPEVLLATNGPRVAWRRPLSEIFTLPRASSDGGWNFDRLTRLGLYVGSVGTTPKITGTRGTVDLAHAMTAGFSVRDGQVRWRSNGFYACTELPCPGRAMAGYTDPENASGSTPAVALRTVAKGSATFSTSGGAPHVSADASVSIQGFDPATGRTSWSFDAGRNAGLISGQFFPARLDPDTIVLRDRSRRLVALNLRTGSPRAVSPATAGWCERTLTYRLSNAGYYQGKSGMYVGQAGLYACTVDGRRHGIPARIPLLISEIGAKTGGMTAWTDTNAVRAAPAG
jgi:outer membrane protein assembly factor BamB